MFKYVLIVSKLKVLTCFGSKASEGCSNLVFSRARSLDCDLCTIEMLFELRACKVARLVSGHGKI